MADTRETLRRKKLAYVRTFCGDNGEVHVNAEAVLADVKRVCGVTRPGAVIAKGTGAVDPFASLYLAGQRDVYLRICGFLGIDEKTLFNGDTHEPSSLHPQAAER